MTAVDARAMLLLLIFVVLLLSMNAILRCARWLPGHCACLARPGRLVCFQFVCAVAGVVARLSAFDAHARLQTLLGEFFTHAGGF
jgi:hypothetical protein